MAEENLKNDQGNSDQQREQRVDGSIIRKVRQWKGLSAEDLATQVGVTATHIYRIERNEANPSIELLTNVSDALEVPVQQFIVTDDQKVSTSSIGSTIAGAALGSVLGPVGTLVGALAGEFAGNKIQMGRVSKQEVEVMSQMIKMISGDPTRAKLMIGNTTIDLPEDIIDEVLRIVVKRLRNEIVHGQNWNWSNKEKNSNASE